MKKILNPEPNTSAGSENREKRADAAWRFLSLVKNIEAFRGRKFEEIFSSEENKREFIENLKPEEFMELLNGINGILRHKERQDWAMDGHTVELRATLLPESYTPPRQEDKPELLRQTLSAAQEMDRNDDSLEDIGLMAAAALNAIHPYLDGNGRTGRMMHLLLASNLGGETRLQLKEVLSETGREKININPGWLKNDIDNLIKNDLGIHDSAKNKDNVVGLTELISDGQEISISGKARLKNFKKEVKKTGRELFLGLLDRDEEYFFYAVYKFISSRPEKDKYTMKFIGRSRIMIYELIKDLDQDDINQIISGYYDIKKQYVEKLIDCLAHPDRPEYQSKDKGNKVSFKEILKGDIRQQSERYVEEKRLKQEEREAEIREQLEMQRREQEAKSRFEAGEGEYETFSPEEINRLREIEAEMRAIIAGGKIAEQESRDLPLEEKIKLLKQVLSRLARHLNSQVKVTSQRIERYIKRNQEELLASLPGYQDTLKLLEYLDSQDIFSGKFRTSKDQEITYSGEPEFATLNKKWQDFYFDDLFSQSVYYTTDRGSSLRVIMYFAKKNDRQRMPQPVMERTFFSDEPIDYTGREVVKAEGKNPGLKKNIFEISSSEFRRAIIGPEAATKELKSGVGTLPAEGGIYVDVPSQALLHTGYHIVNIEK